MTPGTRDEILINYAKHVLQRLEQDESWDSDTIDYIGCMAIEYGLATTDGPYSLFKVKGENE